jgi:arylformamidase
LPATRERSTEQSQRLAKALQQAGASATAHPAKGKDHGTINADLGKADDEPTKVLFGLIMSVLAKDQRH